MTSLREPIPRFDFSKRAHTWVRFLFENIYPGTTSLGEPIPRYDFSKRVCTGTLVRFLLENLYPIVRVQVLQGTTSSYTKLSRPQATVVTTEIQQMS